MVNKYPKIILASKSPRRQELLALLNIDFSLVLMDVDESYPEGLSASQIAVYIAEKKAKAFTGKVQENELVLTADTIVSVENQILGKPDNEKQAFEMLRTLSSKTHEVITGVALLSTKQMVTFFEISHVTFRDISEENIHYYINNYKPYDKAGAYGVQEWIGVYAIEKIVGSYTNIMGLPTQRLSLELEKFINPTGYNF